MDHLERAISLTCSNSQLELDSISSSLLPAPIFASRTALPRQIPMPETSDKLQKWSSEALRAMETHLCLLQQGAARLSFVYRTSNHCFSDGNGSSKRPCLAVEASHYARRNVGAGLADCETETLVELNSQSPLPEGWEQFLDLRTGEIYYVDWKSCKRSYVDPRKVLQLQLANDKASLSKVHGLQFTETEPENSECITDDNTNVAKLDDEMEVDSKWAVPMPEEDWNLMRWRGWLSPKSDNQSEISNEPPSPDADHSSSWSFGAELDQEKILKMGCQQCVSYSMNSEANPWCHQCGNALI